MIEASHCTDPVATEAKNEEAGRGVDAGSGAHVDSERRLTVGPGGKEFDPPAGAEDAPLRELARPRLEPCTNDAGSIATRPPPMWRRDEQRRPASPCERASASSTG